MTAETFLDLGKLLTEKATLCHGPGCAPPSGTRLRQKVPKLLGSSPGWAEQGQSARGRCPPTELPSLPDKGLLTKVQAEV